eukprot:TRINITY_DN6794_c0_g1_i5.p1 TRINITY_DN6794_c0_g1~~TRINITY_DN6794_c0_g1_i5.p1  ORF type:complete len:522 (-),score=147.68 TRINITY_DN6794_c0_g1_i5:310-1875(-)
MYQFVILYLLMLMFFFFFFKQKTAYEMLRSLVGSEMCIRDRVSTQSTGIGQSLEMVRGAALLLLAAMAGADKVYPPYAADAATWNISKFLPYMFDPGCRPIYRGEYQKEGLKDVWVDRPSRDEASLEYQRCEESQSSPTLVNTTVTIKRVDWVLDAETRFGVTLNIRTSWRDQNATGIDPALLWLPTTRFSASTSTLQSSHTLVNNHPSLDGTTSTDVPDVELEQMWSLEVEMPHWEYKYYPFDTKSFRIQFDLGRSRNAIIASDVGVDGSPHHGDDFSGLQCHRVWGNVVLKQVPNTLSSAHYTMSIVEFNMEAHRASHIIVGAYFVPVLAAMLLGWSAFFFRMETGIAAAPVLLGINLLITCVYARSAQELTPSTAWSWLDMLLTLQIVAVALSTAALASCYYIREVHDEEPIAVAIMLSFQVFFPLHAIFGAMVLASILNLWDSNFRYAVAFLWVVLEVMFHLAFCKWLHNNRQQQSTPNANPEKQANPVHAEDNAPNGQPAYSDMSTDKNRQDFPSI